MFFLQTIKKKLIFAHVVLFSIIALYLYYGYESIKENIVNNSKNEIFIYYQLYKKIYKLHGTTKDILIDNPDFINTTDMVEEFSKSLPLFVTKGDKKILKYSLTFKFFPVDISYNGLIQEYINGIYKKEHKLYIKDNKAVLFGKIEDAGYLLISKDIKDYDMESELFIFFRDVSIFAFLNIIIFLYFLWSIKRNKDELDYLEHEYKILQDDTRRLAFEDRLTGAASRIKFDETLKDLIQLASRFKEQKFSLIMIDIDDFKRVNDTYGHDYGDIVLKEVAKIVKNNIRGSDTFARWGGEEFVLLLPMSDLNHSLTLAEKIRSLIAKIEFEKLDRVTCSMGLVEFKDGDNESLIVKRADKLLYKAKRAGKNRVEYK